MKLSLRHKNGFTIVELLIVVAVIAILAAVAVVGYYGVQSNARDKSLLSDIEKVEAELTRYATKNGGLYDSSLNWDSSSGSNANIQFSPSQGNTVLVTANDKGYCIRAYNPMSNSKTLQTAKYKESTEMMCVPGWNAFAMVGDEQSSHSCLIASNDNLYCWGLNTEGQLGNGTFTNSTIPVAVQTAGVLSGKTIKQVVTGRNHTCVIASDNLVYCWGYNSNGELGNGIAGNSNTPVAVDFSGVLNGKTAKSISAGNLHTCIVASDNLPYCWGDNNFSQIGNGSSIEPRVPLAVVTSGALSGKTVKVLVSRGEHNCAIASDDSAYCWGWGPYGQLGHGVSSNSNVPVAVSRAGVLSGLTVSKIFIGGARSCVIASDNKLYCWGLNTNGELGNTSTANMNVPVSPTLSGVLLGKNIVEVGMASNHICALANDGSAYCWGSGTGGELGNGTGVSSTSPVAVVMNGVLSGKTIKTLSTSPNQNTTCVIASDNQVYCWGRATSFRLGNGQSSTNALAPVSVVTSGVLSGKTIKYLRVGGGATCVIASDNRAYCWGTGSSGRLGNGSTTSSSSPVTVTMPSI